jgi:hypothetical protein
VENPVAYRSYLVRLWPTRRGGVADYRVTLHSVATGERRTFHHLYLDDGLLGYWKLDGGTGAYG